MERQSHGGPLILFDAAVVVGLEVGDLGILIQGIGLQIHPGGIHMGGADVGAFGQGLFAHNRQQDALAPVVQVDLVAGLGIHARGEGAEAPLLCLSHSPGGGLTLGLAGIDKSPVALAVVFHFRPLFVGNAGVAVLGSGQQGSTQFFGRHSITPLRFFFHYTQVL